MEQNMVVLNRYKQEYREWIKISLNDYREKIEKRAPSVWQMGHYKVKEDILEEYLSLGCGWEKYYIEEREKGKKCEILLQELKQWIWSYHLPSDYQNGETLEMEIEEHIWYNVLSSYQGGHLIYILYESQLDQVKAFVKGLQGPIVLLSEFEVSDEVDLPDSVVIITIEFTGEGRFSNVFLECNFPLIFHYFNLFDILQHLLRPEEVVIENKTFFQEKIWEEICRGTDTPLKIINNG